MKKILITFLAVFLILNCIACSNNTNSVETTKNNANQPDFKIGAVLIGDENEAYTYAHIEGIKNALKNNGLTEENIIWKYSVSESEAAHDACVDLAESGCQLIITNSYGHQTYTQQAAEEYPDIQFIAITGDTAKKSGLANFHNAFTKIYEARYLAGVVAGLKLAELASEDKLLNKNYDIDKNIKIGYVGAYPYAEVVSGYTSFYLGVKSIIPNVVMDVQYTNSWFDPTGESEAATKLLSDGCVIISQHADSTGAPSAVEEYFNAGNTCYCVGYNIDMLSVAPNTALTSARALWTPYYTYIIKQMLENNSFDTNWSEGLLTNSVEITKLGPNCSKNTQQIIEDLTDKLINGQEKVFDIESFTVNGEKVEHAFATDTDGDFVNDADEAIFDGQYNESYFQSAPSFSFRIDGIKELN